MSLGAFFLLFFFLHDTQLGSPTNNIMNVAVPNVPRFESTMIGNTEDSFSRDEAQIQTLSVKL